MALERDPHRNREHHLVRATEDVQVAALEVHREAAEWQIVSEAGIEAEVPLAIRVSEEGVHVVGAVVTDATRDIQAAIGRRRAEVVLTINRDAEASVLRARVTDVVGLRLRSISMRTGWRPSTACRSRSGVTGAPSTVRITSPLRIGLHDDSAWSTSSPRSLPSPK